MDAQRERLYDQYEQSARQAMMQRAAYHAKKLKETDLFKRPTDADTVKVKTQESRAKAEDAMAWIAQFEEFSYVADNGGKEEMNG